MGDNPIRVENIKIIFESLEDVAVSDPQYLIWLTAEASIDPDSYAYIEEFIQNNPDYFEDIEL